MSCKITVERAGYVGMSLSALLAKDNLVTLHDMDKKRIKILKDKKLTIKDLDINAY